MKKLSSLILSITLVFNIIFINATSTSAMELSSFEGTYTIEELEDGVEVTCIYDSEGKIYAVQNDSQISTKGLIDLIVFSVKLHRATSTQGFLRWSITLTSTGVAGLKKITGTMYCKSASIFKEPYADQNISCTLITPVYTTSGSGARFDLPEAGTLVKVGWKNVIVRTVDNAVSLENVWSWVRV